MLYIVGISTYLFTATSSLPAEWSGSPADPSTFMTPDQIEKSYTFSRIKDIVYFIGGPLEWGIYLIVLGSGLAVKFRNIASSVGKGHFLKLLVFIFLLTLITSLLYFPLDYYSFYLRHVYGISHESFDGWMKDNLKSFWLSLALTTPIVWLFYFIVKKSPKRWWFWFWLISIPITLFLMFIQPVVIDPIFHDFTPLKNGQLKEDILSLAAKSHIPAKQVYEVDMSKKTEALNAYVNGIGANTRIVLWDTTLKKLKKDEILFIMAHEMGHYALKHMFWLFIGSVWMSFAALLLLFHLWKYAVARFGPYWGIKSVNDMASLPVILLLISVLSFVSMPMQNAVSRHFEHAADVYALKMLPNKDTAARTFQRLAVESLAEVNPPLLVKIFLYNHPTLYERILFVEKYK